MQWIRSDTIHVAECQSGLNWSKGNLLHLYFLEIKLLTLLLSSFRFEWEMPFIWAKLNSQNPLSHIGLEYWNWLSERNTFWLCYYLPLLKSLSFSSDEVPTAFKVGDIKENRYWYIYKILPLVSGCELSQQEQEFLDK